MAKYLHIIRHGKSSWDLPSVEDLDRPLIEKGIKNALATGSKLLEHYGKPDKIISSPAIRAMHTALIVGRVSGVSYKNITVDDRIYDSYSSSLIDVIEETEAEINRLVLVGHNPILTEFSNLFLPDYIENLPTAGMVTLIFDINDWNIVDKQPIDSNVFFPNKNLI